MGSACSFACQSCWPKSLTFEKLNELGRAEEPLAAADHIAARHPLVRLEKVSKAGWSPDRYDDVDMLPCQVGGKCVRRSEFPSANLRSMTISLPSR